MQGGSVQHPCLRLITLLEKQNMIKKDTNQEHFVRRTLSEEVLLETVNLMHPLVQDRHDADVPVRQAPPVHEVMFVREVEALNPELGRDGPRCNAVLLDLVECRE